MQYPIDEEFTIFSDIEVNSLDKYPSIIQCIESIRTFKEKIENDKFWLSEKKFIHRFIVLHYTPYETFITVFKDLYNFYKKSFPHSSPLGFLKSHFHLLSYRSNEMLKPMTLMEFFAEDEFYYVLGYEEANNSKTFIFIEKNPELSISQLLHQNEIKLQNISNLLSAFQYKMDNDYKIKIDKLLGHRNNELEDFSEQHIIKQTKKSKSISLKGKPLNLNERFKIANSVLEIDRMIRTLNIQDQDKYKLLAIIMGCNETNARLVMNGNYQGKIREKEIAEYLNTFK